MKRFSQIFFYFTVAMLLVWQLPWCYDFFTTDKAKTPFAIYSTVVGEFVTLSADDNGLIRYDQSGRHYTQEQTDSVLPFFYMRQLMADQRFPDSLCGVAIAPKEAQTHNFSFRSSPAAINAHVVTLYPLLESMSRRVELAMPDDVFRITDRGIEFVRMESNAVDAAKSSRFTEALLAKGFAFPARLVAGNPSTRKEYDNGYLLLDHAGKLFHLKMTAGRPYVRAIALPERLQIEHLYVTEFTDRQTLGFLTDAAHRFYVLTAHTYEVVQSGIPAFNPATDNLVLFGNMFDWSACVSTPDSTLYYALRADDYRLISTMGFADKNRSLPSLHFTSYLDNDVRPRF